MKANEIVSVLNHFKDSSYQRVFIDGTWGIGKTKYVLDFKKAHSDACYVSLFGKKDTESIIQEIYFQIIDSVPNGKFKKYSRKVREIFNNINIEFHGLTISVPLIEKLHSTLYKELDKKGTYIIIFDDLERKHHDLDIKEILGLIDSLAKIENIKTVLIAATDQLGEAEETFNNYKEKAIDRTYTIEEYADEAPLKILGEEIWKVIGIIAEEFEFNNLRTFEKTSLFIKEVIDILGEEIFTEKFTRDDVYRMCFATVFCKIEHKDEMILLNNGEPHSDIRNAFYTTGESGVIEYLYNYILKNSLDNVMCKSVFHHIRKWYETGSYSKEIIMDLIESINSYKEKPKNFYSSEEDILGVIENTRKYMRNLNGSEPLDDIISRLNTAFSWCEVLSVDFGISIEEIVRLVEKNIPNKIELTKSSYQNGIDLWGYHIESEEARKVVKSINEALKVEYYNLLLKKIRDCFIQQSYNEYLYLRQLQDSISTIKDTPIRDIIVKSMSDNQFFFPIPAGSITEKQWYWCRIIKVLIINIEEHWEIENYYKDFKSYIYGLEITKQDKILQHRLRHLFEKK
ncbi:P-loop NTPase fold protein [Exiguobacterium sp.]|uniref:P-loop NTPase fold protein n=1 Tax=Exiguobacterium sp. TaxID=44751 RepID=UPI00307D288D